MSAKLVSPFMQPARISRSVMNCEQAHFLAANYKIYTVFAKPPQPGAAHIGKSNGVQQGVLRQGRDDRFNFIEKLVSQPRLLFVVTDGSQQLIFLNDPGF